MRSVQIQVGERAWVVPNGIYSGLSRLAYDLAHLVKGEERPRVLISQIYDRPGSGGRSDDTPPELAELCVLELAAVTSVARPVEVCDFVDVQRGETVWRVPFAGHIPVTHAGPDRGELWYGSWRVLRATPAHRVAFRSVMRGVKEFVQAPVAAAPGFVVMQPVDAEEQASQVLDQVTRFATTAAASAQVEEWYRLEAGAPHEDPDLLAVCRQGLVTQAGVVGRHGVVPQVRIMKSSVDLRDRYSSLISTLSEAFLESTTHDLPAVWTQGDH